MNILHKTVFGRENEYFRSRIPGIVCTEKGTLISYCELRSSDSDWAVIDIGMKKSTDEGESWSELKILVSGNKKDTVNNPLMITDGDIIHFLYCINYKRVFYMKSSDEGESWTTPRELTQCITEQTGGFFRSCIATGPTHGIKTSDGVLLVPVWLAYNREDEKSHHPSVIALLFSADGGESWRMGEIYDGLCDASEFSVAELSGKIVANIRHENPMRCRAAGEISSRYGICNVRLMESLPDPVCCAGMCAAGSRLLFTNCADEKQRINLTLRVLDEDFNTVESIFLSEDAGYSDVCVSPDKSTAFVLFEKEREIFFVKVPIAL